MELTQKEIDQLYDNSEYKIYHSTNSDDILKRVKEAHRQHQTTFSYSFIVFQSYAELLNTCKQVKALWLACSVKDLLVSVIVYFSWVIKDYSANINIQLELNNFKEKEQLLEKLKYSCITK